MNGRDGSPQQSRVAGGVQVGAVVERIGVAGKLNPEVPICPAAGTDRAAAETAERLGKLVALGVVDQVAALDYRVGAERADGR